MTEADIVKWVITGIGALIALAEKMGHRDAALVAADEALAIARQKTDEDLTAKHRVPHNGPPEPPGGGHPT